MKTWLLSLLLILVFSFAGFSQPTNFIPSGIGGGGALFFPSINPANDDEFYVSCDMSELFHSTDYGLSYSQIHFSKLQVFNTSTYEFTNDPNIAYCNFNDGNEGYPVKTIDGGNTWAPISAYNTGVFGSVYSMRSNYNNPLQLLIGAYGDILFSDNGGATLSLVKHAANMGAGIIMGGVFWEGDSIYIGTNEGILFSGNGGGSFTLLPTTGMTAGQVIWSFAGAKTSGIKRFVCIAANASDTYNGIMPWEYYNYAKAVYVMDHANGTWIPSSSGINFSNDFIMYAGMAWNDISTIYLGGNDNALSAPLVYKSEDGGSSWTKKFNTTNNSNIITGWEGFGGDKNWSWSENCFGISVAPYNSSKVIFSTFSNVQLSDNGGDTWKQAYVSTADQHPAGNSTPRNQAYHSVGLENTTCWQVHWKNPTTMMGCFSDIGGIRSVDAGNSWGYLYNGFSVNSLYRIVEDNNGIMYGACSNIHDMYQSTRLADAQLDAFDGNGKIVYSADEGATWATLHTFNHPVFWLAIDPNNPARMYASVIHFGGTVGAQQGGIYMTNDLSNLSASNWIKLSDPPRTEGHPACLAVLNDGKIVCTFSGRRNAAGTFTPSSGVFVFDPVLNSWTDVSDNGMHYWTKDIIIDPGDASQNTWYVCVFSGWGGAPNGLGGLFKTTDRGVNWSKLTGSQFDRVSSITFTPQNLNQAYLTTETQGLWISNDMNLATPLWQLVQSYPFRQPERVFFNPYNQNELWVSSFGNGMKTGSLTTSGLNGQSLFSENRIRIYPNPNNGVFSLSIRTNGCSTAELTVVNMSGKITYEEKIKLNAGENNFTMLSGKLLPGIYSVIVQTNDETCVSKLVYID